jgi:hypothetical protein
VDIRQFQRLEYQVLKEAANDGGPALEAEESVIGEPPEFLVA